MVFAQVLLLTLGLASGCGSEVADLAGPTPGPTPGPSGRAAGQSLLENEHVLVQEVVVAPGASLDRGQREDRLMLALTPVVLAAYEGADRERVELNPGDVVWWEAVIERLVNPTDEEARFLEIVRRPSQLPPPPAVPPERRLDDVEGAEVLVENRDVRVVQATAAPGTGTGSFWTLPGVLVVEQGALQAVPSDGDGAPIELAAGDVVWLEQGSYVVANVADAPMRFVVVAFGR